jgi:hypothetical protein
MQINIFIVLAPDSHPASATDYTAWMRRVNGSIAPAAAEMSARRWDTGGSAAVTKKKNSSTAP